MTEFLTRIAGNLPALAIVGGSVVALASVVSGVVFRMRRDSLAAQLKQDMLDRGMSAEEIKTVLEAGSSKS